MTAYEKELLALAVEASDGDLSIETFPGGPEGVNRYVYVSDGVDAQMGFRGSTLTEALTALLRDLGVDVPALPGPGDLAAIGVEYLLADLPGLYKADPLWVLAWLEGGES